MKTNLGLDEFIGLGLDINKFPFEKSFGGFDDRNKDVQIVKLKDIGKTTDYLTPIYKATFSNGYSRNYTATFIRFWIDDKEKIDEQLELYK
jgi:hypothetical protein